ncbi:phosphate signaling complex protein PhoU [Nocardia sp. NBC_01503]|uniref:phosphate signaling complex protein PhoU n=1 Tax=Nocardia TaxID=1817 RepID=UPI00083289C3|nr:MULTISPECIES: phosphate signaling complex protein PhoU [Nocardia]WTL34169.1 phosphate signaling complex protein PhoU [Nocardia sp. NBC_01503]
MRVIYNEQMAELADLLGGMAGLAGSAMERATNSLLNADLELAEQVITEYDRIAEMIQLAEEKAFALLALQAPVAGDLRQVVSAIQIVADVNRMGALALHVAKMTRRRFPNHAVPEAVNSYFAEMGRIAVKMGATAKEVLETRDPERAAKLTDDDEAMDDLRKHLFTLIMDRDWQFGVPSAVDVALLGRYYERFADHAVEIGRRVVFLVTGVLPPDPDSEKESI